MSWCCDRACHPLADVDSGEICAERPISAVSVGPPQLVGMRLGLTTRSCWKRKDSPVRSAGAGEHATKVMSALTVESACRVMVPTAHTPGGRTPFVEPGSN